MGKILEGYKKEFVPRFDKDGITPYLSYKDFDGLNFYEGSFKNSIDINIHYFCYYYDNYKKDKIIVFCHGIGPGHTAYVREIETLAKKGYFVLTIDYCGCDRSEGKAMESINEPTRDVCDFIKYIKAGKDDKLKEFKDLEIVLVGHSLGAYTALNVINLNKDIKKAVIISGFISLMLELKGATHVPFGFLFNSITKYEKKVNKEYSKINNLKYLKNTTDKILLIHSLDDEVVPYKTSTYKIYKNNKNKNLDFLIVNNKYHNPNYSIEAVKYMRETFSLFSKLIKEGKLNSFEEKKAFMNEKDVFKMTKQDEEVWNKIFMHIEK